VTTAAVAQNPPVQPGPNNNADDAHSYAEGIRRGGSLVTARVPDSDRSRLEALLDESAVNLRDRTAQWQKTGWKSFDPTAQPYGADEVRRERQLYTGLNRV
jgi:hypothetical protein